jgi:hypothetical protein
MEKGDKISKVESFYKDDPYWQHLRSHAPHILFYFESRVAYVKDFIDAGFEHKILTLSVLKDFITLRDLNLEARQLKRRIDQDSRVGNGCELEKSLNTNEKEFSDFLLRYPALENSIFDSYNLELFLNEYSVAPEIMKEKNGCSELCIPVYIIGEIFSYPTKTYVTK